MPELFELYHGKGSDERRQTNDSLIGLRNQDAHGSPIAEHELETELDRRQEMLEGILEGLGFLQAYRFIVMDSFEIEEGQTTYSGKEFVSDGFMRCTLKTEASLPLSEIIAFDPEKKMYLKLSPFLIHTTLDDQEVETLSTFSKIINEKNGMTAQFISLDGKSTVNLKQRSRELDNDLQDRMKMVLEVFSDPSREPVHEPNLVVDAAFSNSLLSVQDPGKMVVKVRNVKSTTLYDCRFRIDFPTGFGDLLCSSELAQMQDETNSVQIVIDEVPNGMEESIEVDFVPESQGHFIIKPGLINYKYFRRQSDVEAGRYTDGEFDAESTTVEVKDPNSKDDYCPVLNIEKRYAPLEGEIIEIGKPFTFEIALENVGFGLAKDASLELVFPQEFTLMDGAEELKASLNPLEKRSFKYVLATEKPGIYSTTIRNITYLDGGGRKYATRSDDDHKGGGQKQCSGDVPNPDKGRL